jgi:hypothetical protein
LEEAVPPPGETEVIGGEEEVKAYEERIGDLQRMVGARTHILDWREVGAQLRTTPQSD